jgi:hypothetical protein
MRLEITTAVLERVIMLPFVRVPVKEMIGRLLSLEVENPVMTSPGRREEGISKGADEPLP